MRAVSSASSTVAFATLFAAAAIVGLGGALAAPTPGFTVTDEVSFERVSLHVEGAITVADGGVLMLDAVDLLITSGEGTPASLIVQQGGAIIVRDSTLRSDGAGFRFEIAGSADIEASSILAVASDPSAPMGRALAGGLRSPGGGVRLLSSDIVFTDVRVQGAVGCGLTLESASPTLVGLEVAQIRYRVDGSTGYAAALCILGGSPTIDGLTLSDIGSGASAGASKLLAAGVLADAPGRLEIRGIEAASFVPTLAGFPAARSVAVFIEDSSSVLISGGRIEGTTDGIVMRGTGSASGTTTIEALVINIPSGPVSVIQAYSTDPSLSFPDLQITGCSSQPGLYVESTSSGIATTVTVTVSNVTATSCGRAGIELFNNGALGPHAFNVWDSNASQNAQQGFYLHGQNMGAGLAVQMSNNQAWRNTGAGFVVSTTYAATAGAKLASTKLENNLAENNSLSSSSFNGGFILDLGAPSTMSMNYVNNIARGNQNTGSTDYGHYFEVAVTSTLTIPYGFFSGIVAEYNGEYGIGIWGGSAQFSRFDKARIRDSNIVGHTTLGIQGYYARIEVWNSTMSNTKEIEGQNTAFFLMGVVHNRLAGSTSGLFKIVSYKQVCLHGEWQNGAPLYLIPLTFINGDNAGASMYSDVSVDPPLAAQGRSTDVNGNWSGWTLDWTYDPQAPSAQQVVDHAPFTISVQLFQTSASAGPFNLYTNVCGPQTFIDPNPPDVTISAPTENGTYTTSNLSVQGRVSDDLSGMAGLQVSVDGVGWTNLAAAPGLFSHTFSNLSDGVFDLRVRAWDRANDGLAPRNETLVVLFSITIDTVAPALTLEDPPLQDGGQYWTANNNIFFRGAVDGSVVLLFINGKSINITGTAFVELGELPNEGPQSFLFLAIDAAGNAKTLKVTIFRDQVVPTLIITKPAQRGEIYVASHAIEIEGITDPNVVVTVNGQLTTLSPAGTTFHADLVLLEGRTTINITAIDAAGNKATRSIGVTSDTVAPAVQLQSHRHGVYLNASEQRFTGTLSEPVALFEVNLRYFPVAALDFSALLGLAEGDNRISINATDKAGNVGRLVITVIVDTVAPEILLIGLSDFQVRNNAVLNIQGSVSEDAELTVEGDEVFATDLQFDASLTLVEGLNTIELTAVDQAGNRGVLVRRVTLDTGQPTLLITEPAAGSVVRSGTVHVVGTSEPNALVEVGGQYVVADATGRFEAWVDLDSEGTHQIALTVTDAAGNSLQESFTVNYEEQVIDTSGDIVLGVVLLAALGGGLAIASMFLARRRVDGELEEARGRRAQAEAVNQGTPGYTEAPPAEYDAPAPDAGYYAEGAPADAAYSPEAAQAEGAFDPNAQAPPPEAAPPPPPPPRAPRPPRPPSS